MITIKSNAKINIGLNIVRKLENGYHDLDMVMVPIDLFDKLIIDFKNKKGKLYLTTNNKNIPVDERNIIHKIYKKFYEKTGYEEEEVNLYLEKNIPTEAGLGGGSSNGAFFLKELNKYHKDILSEKEMVDLGKEIGADIPFFIKNKPCRVRGTGEELEVIKNNLDCDIILIKPNFGVSTKKAYTLYENLKEKKKADIEKIIYALEKNDKEEVEKVNENALEQALLLSDFNIKIFREELIKIKGIKFFMTGSGSTYYLFAKKNEAANYIKRITKEINDCSVYSCSFL